MTFTVHKLNAQGEHVLSYNGDLLERGATWVRVRAIFTAKNVDLGHVTLNIGDIFDEWFYTDRMYNVFRVIHPQTRQTKAWYCNITRPAQVSENAVQSDDLALDVLVLPNREIYLLDEDEFEALPLADAERQAAWDAVADIRRLVKAYAVPFDNETA